MMPFSGGYGSGEPATSTEAALHLANRYRSRVVIRHAKIGYRLVGMAAMVAPLLRESRTWHADQGPEVSELLRPRPAETLDALGYWIERRRRLPFYRRSDRREADHMIRVWQERAVHDVPAAALEALTSGRVLTVGGQVARYHAGRLLTRLSRGALFVAMMFAVLIVLAARL
jgi:hypothetical protein